jgi:ATP/maltotriose-dependent transcriptional regulator MalT
VKGRVNLAPFLDPCRKRRHYGTFHPPYAPERTLPAALDCSPPDPVQAGRDALARGAWPEALDCFKSALDGDVTPEALEGFGMASWWLEDNPTAISSREEAYRAYRRRQDRAGAARMAAWLANDYADYKGELAVANGWIRLAERLLDGLPRSPEHAFLAYTKAHFALMVHRDPSEARRWSAEAADIGRTVGPADFEMLGVALEGLALVTEGAVADGLGRLDEASAAITAGEITDPVFIGVTCCYLIRACEQVRDYDRAAQWCERVREFCARWNYTSLFSACRIQYASLLTTRGEWTEAEREIDALHRHVERVQPRLVPVARARMAELRRVQGRRDEADRLLAEAGPHLLATLVRAALALDRGDASAAADQAEEYLRRVPPASRTERVHALEILIVARAAQGSLDAADGALAELREVAALIGTDPLRAITGVAEGALLAARGDRTGASAKLQESAELYEQSRAPFDAARTRLRLGRVLRELGRREAAVDAARAAQRAFATLGALADAETAASLLSELEAAPRIAGKRPPTEKRLTAREIQILRLVAEGLSDREVAARLDLSEHTVHRHVTNILTKTGLPSRAAAVAYAAKAGVL